MSYTPGINGVAIYEETTPTTFTIDGKDLGSSSPDITPVNRQSGRGTLKKITNNFSWSINHDNESTHNSIDAASHDTPQWLLAAWTFTGGLFVTKEATFAPEPTPQFDPESEDFPFRVQYDVITSNVAHDTNLIYAYKKAQGQSQVSNGTTNVTITIPFPFEGATLTLSNGATSITIEALDGYSSGDTVLGTATTSTGSGRVSAELTLPANTRAVKVTIDDYQDAALRVDGSTVYPN